VYVGLPHPFPCGVVVVVIRFSGVRGLEIKVDGRGDGVGWKVVVLAMVGTEMDGYGGRMDI
jgi:hypothetical protein